MYKFIKSIFSKCNHEPDFNNSKEYKCIKCNCKLSGVTYTTGGIGMTDDYFSWRIRQSYDSLKPLINWEERLISVKKRLKEEQNIDIDFEITSDDKIRITRKEIDK